MDDPQDLLVAAQRWRDAAAGREALNWRDIYLTLAEAYEQAAREHGAPQPEPASR
ncbi:MAG: hypothetical protein P4L71_12435 [Acetobacteraceae bacterium]|nr:hypothetical protein [Acetobacteraceae bacterium]